MTYPVDGSLANLVPSVYALCANVSFFFFSPYESMTLSRRGTRTPIKRGCYRARFHPEMTPIRPRRRQTRPRAGASFAYFSPAFDLQSNEILQARRMINQKRFYQCLIFYRKFYKDGATITASAGADRLTGPVRARCSGSSNW